MDSEEEESKSSISNQFDTEKRRLLPPSLESYIIGCKLGSSGHFGSSSLWLAKFIQDEECCLYVMRKTIADNLTQKDLTNMQEEIKITAALNNRNILFSYTSFVTDSGIIWSVFPLFNFGSCHDLIVAEFHTGLPILFVTMVLRSVLLALCYLHKLGYIHRAVKGSHILVNSDGTICLSGLRYCYALEDGGKYSSSAHSFPSNSIPLFPWLAPEVLQQDLCGYNYKADVYSLGITAVELVTGTIPFNKLCPTEILLQKLRGVVPQLPDEAIIEDLQCADANLSSSQLSLEGIDQTNDMMFSPLSTNTSYAPFKRIRSLQQFVDVCLQSDPNSRPSAQELKDCPYIRLVKRRLKDKDCKSFVEILKPMTPVKEFRAETSNSDSLNAFDDVELNNGVCSLDVDYQWNF